ncbi:MAG: methionyl-tRNA formyltransferase [Dehalococcoidales bacterium]|jgi:hypothetical protein|nr:methionyl-tRNA formyltransferase [Dehalococcoidales bacterium]|tara:strand:- start:2456 stop:3250 length:795 start_codon:yes stop_codon:yes gene_type:complete
MKITVFTSNQPRHLALVNCLSAISEKTFAIIECNTVFPGLIEDFYRKSRIMRSYFNEVLRAERQIFGDLIFLPPNVRMLLIKSGDLNFIRRETILSALESDIYIVYGASYIKSWLIDFLVSRRAINIHIGISPYYRGTSCNFWALYDYHPGLVGATIHLLSKGLDSGAMLYHALPIFDQTEPFNFTMKAVHAAQISLVEKLLSNELQELEPMPQDKEKQIRYTRNIDFTDEIAAEFLARRIEAKDLGTALTNASDIQLLRPVYI